MKSAAFKKDDAIAFATAHNLGSAVREILGIPIHPEIRGKPWAVKKGYFLELFEREGLLDAFAAQYWPARNTPEGEKVLKRYLSAKAINEDLLVQDPPDPDATVAASTIEAGSLETAAEVTFGLERDLQAALRSNIEQLEPGLQVSDGGKERLCDAGRIDITARDSAGTTVIIELKAGVARPDALTQLLAYMGVVAAEQQGPVRGMLIAEDFDQKVLFGSRAVPTIQLWRYRFKFTFEKSD